MKRDERDETIHDDLEARVREGVQAVFEQLLEEEISQHLGAEPYGRSPSRGGQRNGQYERDLVTGVGPSGNCRCSAIVTAGFRPSCLSAIGA